MQHNGLKCGEIVDDFCYIPKTVCSMKEDLGVGFGLILGLMFRISEYGIISHGYNITRNGFYDP